MRSSRVQCSSRTCCGERTAWRSFGHESAAHPLLRFSGSWASTCFVLLPSPSMRSGRGEWLDRCRCQQIAASVWGAHPRAKEQTCPGRCRSAGAAFTGAPSIAVCRPRTLRRRGVAAQASLCREISTAPWRSLAATLRFEEGNHAQRCQQCPQSPRNSQH